MLVLTRKVNQQIRLGEDITITVLRVQGNSIRIGVDAPRNVRVLRGELEPRDQASMETIELDVQELLGEAPPEEMAEEMAAKRESAEPQVYQMRTTTPLSRFVRTPVDAVVSSSMAMQ